MSKGYNAVMSKKRYYELFEYLKSRIDDEELVLEIDNKIKEIFNFDPTKPACNQKYNKKYFEKRKQRALEEGKSYYELYVKPKRESKESQKTDNENE